MLIFPFIPDLEVFEKEVFISVNITLFIMMILMKIETFLSENSRN